MNSGVYARRDGVEKAYEEHEPSKFYIKMCRATWSTKELADRCVKKDKRSKEKKVLLQKERGLFELISKSSSRISNIHHYCNKIIQAQLIRTHIGPFRLLIHIIGETTKVRWNQQMKIVKWWNFKNIFIFAIAYVLS